MYLSTTHTHIYILKYTVTWLMLFAFAKWTQSSSRRRMWCSILVYPHHKSQTSRWYARIHAIRFSRYIWLLYNEIYINLPTLYICALGPHNYGAIFVAQTLESRYEPPERSPRARSCEEDKYIYARCGIYKAYCPTWFQANDIFELYSCIWDLWYTRLESNGSLCAIVYRMLTICIIFV